MSLAHLRNSFGGYWGVLVFGDVGTRSIPNLGNEPPANAGLAEGRGDFLGTAFQVFELATQIRASAQFNPGAWIGA